MFLACFPHAGGAAGPFSRWDGRLGDDVQIVPVEYPGHGRRMFEGCAAGWPAVVADSVRTVEAARSAGSDRYALFGHSFGALVALETARALSAVGRPPALLVVAGLDGPSAERVEPLMHPLPDREFVAELDRLGGMPAEILAEPELLQVLLPIVRADVTLAETHTRSPGPPLACPILAFGGRADRLTRPGGLAAWAAETTGDFELCLLDAGHFLLDEPAFTARLDDALWAVTPVAQPA